MPPNRRWEAENASHSGARDLCRDMTPIPSEAGGSLHWRVYPAHQRPAVTVGLLAYMLGLSWLAGPFLLGAASIAEPRGIGGASLVFCAFYLALARWFFPTEYRIDDEGVHSRFMFIRRDWPWSRFRSWRRERGGIYMSPLSDPIRFDRFRGVMLLVDETSLSADSLTAFVDERLQARQDPPPGVG